MPEPRDPLLKVLTYSVQKTQRGHVIQELGIPPAGARRGPGGAAGHEGRAPPAEATVKVTFTMVYGVFRLCNDPSAGSPTETLLRLLLPLNDRVWIAFRP